MLNLRNNEHTTIGEEDSFLLSSPKLTMASLDEE